VEDGLGPGLRGRFGADCLAEPAVDASVGDHVGQTAECHLEVSRPTVDRLDRGASPDVEIRIVDGLVAVEALAHAGLVVGGRQALAAVVRGKDGADAGGAAAEERPPLDELDPVTHLGEFGGGLRAGDAAADDQHRVLAPAVREHVGSRGGEADGGLDEAQGLACDRVDVVAVDPRAALADVGDLHAQAARGELLEAARGEVGGATGEDEAAFVAPLHDLEHLRPTLAPAPVRAAHDLSLGGDGGGEAVEVDVRHGAGALAEEDARARPGRCRGRHRARARRRRTAAHIVHGVTSPLAAPASVGAAASGVAEDVAAPPPVVGNVGVASPVIESFGASASMASAGQLRAQVPHPRQSSAS